MILEYRSSNFLINPQHSHTCEPSQTEYRSSNFLIKMKIFKYVNERYCYARYKMIVFIDTVVSFSLKKRFLLKRGIVQIIVFDFSSTM